MKKIKFIIALVAIMISGSISAQATYQVTRKNISNGGGLCTDGRFQVHGTISQSFIGLSQGNRHRGKIGFWHHRVSPLTTSFLYADEPNDGDLGLHIEPNPTYDLSRISFELSRPSSVTLRVLDVLGREVQVLVDKYLSPGLHEVLLSATKMTGGIYLCHLQAESNSVTKQWIVRK